MQGFNLCVRASRCSHASLGSVVFTTLGEDRWRGHTPPSGPPTHTGISNATTSSAPTDMSIRHESRTASSPIARVPVRAGSSSASTHVTWRFKSETSAPAAPLQTHFDPETKSLVLQQNSKHPLDIKHPEEICTVEKTVS